MLPNDKKTPKDTYNKKSRSLRAGFLLYNSYLYQPMNAS